MTQNLLAADSPFISIIGMMFTFMGLFTAYAGSLKSEFSTANDYITPLSFYPNSFSMIMFLIGVVLILFISLWRIYDANPDSTKKPGMFLIYCRQIANTRLPFISLILSCFLSRCESCIRQREHIIYRIL